MSYLINAYARMPLRVVSGQGAWLTTEDGRRVFDAISGIGVCSLGHAHPEIADTIASQATQLVHTSNAVHIPVQEALAERLCTAANMEHAFFANSGAEANECAIKLSRLHGHQRGIEAPGILVFEGGFHGRTMGGISASEGNKLRAGFEPLLPGFHCLPFADLDAVAHALDNNKEISAIFLEPIQGEGGVVIPPQGYLTGLRKLCDQHDVLLMADEVQTGVGKTGRWFACAHEDVQPDALTVAKALGNGFPVAACLTQGHASSLIQPGKHGSTWGGNPLGCAVGLKVMEIMQRDATLAYAAQQGEQLRQQIAKGLEGVAGVVEVRGRGLMIGVELDRACGEVRDYALEHDIIINVTRDSRIRLLPPLNCPEAEYQHLGEVVVAGVRHFLAS
jgi:acetylornithine aminotransferase